MLKIDTAQIGTFLFYGFSKVAKYRTNLKEHRKKTKSRICLFGIILGGILGVLIPLVIEPRTSDLVADILHFTTNWFIIVCTVLFLSSFTATFFLILFKFIYRQYNYFKFGNTNTQYTELTDQEIIKIQDNDWNLGDFKLKLTKSQIVNINNSLITIIKAHKNAADRKNIKTSHLRFRKGNVNLALLTEPFVLKSLIYTELKNSQQDEAAKTIFNYFTPYNNVVNYPFPENILQKFNQLKKSINSNIRELEYLVYSIPNLSYTDSNSLDSGDIETGALL